MQLSHKLWRFYHAPRSTVNQRTHSLESFSISGYIFLQWRFKRKAFKNCQSCRNDEPNKSALLKIGIYGNQRYANSVDDSAPFPRATLIRFISMSAIFSSVSTEILPFSTNQSVGYELIISEKAHFELNPITYIFNASRQEHSMVIWLTSPRQSGRQRRQVDRLYFPATIAASSLGEPRRWLCVIFFVRLFFFSWVLISSLVCTFLV